ncbi:retron system putative HNH endonuclease [Shewanella sp. 10N.286.45.A1]|uniref:retron system putative HNH endonuclease n=1 Tax=Shewanella sp. 10N.286.45.A1 TaxID=3229694 RepID=UPI0035541E66
MKNIVKGKEPPLLVAYRAGKPNFSWPRCKSNSNRRDEIQDYLRRDQGGICAYCEIDLLKRDVEGEESDFQVEHFHPKSDKTTAHNWALDWDNMLACCLGGKSKNVVDADNRHTNPNLRCGALKDDDDLDNIILNPLNLPHSPLLYNFQRTTGETSVNEDNCNLAGVDIGKAQATIDCLNLKSERLNRLRQEQLAHANKNLQVLVNSGLTAEQARQKLALALMKKDGNGCWPKFFSALRCYLGSAAEEQLLTIGFTG